MIENMYNEKLVWFKQNEKPETVLLLVENPELAKLVIAWTNLDVHISDVLNDDVVGTEVETWEWLWANTVYNLMKFKEIVGVPMATSVLESKLKRLIYNRIIYPDGTINSYVQRYLREQVVKLFEKRPKKSSK